MVVVMVGVLMARTDPLIEITKAAVADDTELQERARKLINLTLRQAEIDITTGTPQVRHALMRAVIPAIVKLSENQQQVDELAELREQMALMQQSFQQGIAVGVSAAAVVEPELTDDGLPIDAPVRTVPGFKGLSE